VAVSIQAVSAAFIKEFCPTFVQIRLSDFAYFKGRLSKICAPGKLDNSRMTSVHDFWG
jgi:hypothetical protein